MHFWDPQNESSGIPWIGLSLGITIGQIAITLHHASFSELIMFDVM